MALRDEIRAEQSKLKDKPFKDKWNYFWDYYKIHVIVGICLVFFIGSLVKDMLGNKPYGFYGLLLNSTSYAEMEPYEQEFAQIIGLDQDKYSIDIDNTTNVKADGYDELTMASIEKIMASIAASEIDVFVADQDTIRKYGYNETLMDLRNILPAETLEKYKDQLLYIDMLDVRLEQEKTMNIFGETEEETGANGDGEDFEAAGSGAGTAGEDTETSADEAAEAEEDLFAMLYTDPSGMTEPVPVGIYLTDSKVLEETQSYLNCTPVYAMLINTKHPANAVSFLHYLTGEAPLTEDDIFAIETKAALLQ